MTVVTITASGPFVVPAGVTVLDEVLILAGGGGGGMNAAGPAGGGGSGERRVITALAVTPAETLDAVIGAGGLGKTGATGSGGSGGNSTFKRGATTLGQANGGTGGTSTTGGAGGTGGTGGTGTNGNPGVGDQGGVSVEALFPSKSAGGNGGDGTAPYNGTNGAIGVIQITYTVRTPLDSLTYSLSISAIGFLKWRVTPLETANFGLTISDVVFGRRTTLDPLAYNLTIGSIGFSTSGGVVPLPPTNIVLPNRTATQRSLPATWANLRFRNFDSVPTRTQKLELLRERTAGLSNRTMMLSFVEGLPTANPAEPLVRIILLEPMTTGAIVATAGNAATGTVAFRFFKNGVANGTVSFTGTTGTESGVGDWAAGDRFEIYPPTTADPTLDDVSISIPVTLG